MSSTLVSEAHLTDVPEGKHVLTVLDRTGDSKIIWDPENPTEVENARRTFHELLAKGFQAFSVNRRGDKNSQVRDFDPDAEKLIFTPAMQGG